ncbi:hypothetical protein [Hyphomicrobium sp.]|jgi:hypothetical protein|uniref:hypothetical protein n=1 Tax=Hyphomicrobium sp. TaxID=82 RepID=UPI003566CDC8
MFEKALITRTGNTDLAVDAGLLAETLFFYGSTQLLLNRGALMGLCQTLPRDDLLALLKHERMQLSYLNTAFVTLSSGPFAAMQFTAMQMASAGKEKRIPNYQEEIEEVLGRALGTGASTRNLTRALTDKATPFRFGQRTLKMEEILEAARADLANRGDLAKAVRIALNKLVPTAILPPTIRFEMVPINSGGFLIDTNLDFKMLNVEYHKLVPPSHSTVTTEFLLSFILDARCESAFAASYMAELVTAPLFSELIRAKHFSFLRPREDISAAIDEFPQIVLPGFPTIRETINSGAKTIVDFLKLLDQADQFKSWLQTVNPDRGLIAEYVTKATEKSWADNLPTKSVRFVIANGIGLAAEAVAPSGLGVAAGLGFSAIDTFYLDKLLNGWKPNHFIEGPYREFVSRS